MRIAIVGTGLIAHTNYEAMKKTGRCEITALCNRTPEKAKAFAAQYGLSVPVYSDYREMLAKDGFDAVLLNTPHGAHASQVKDCAAAGKHLMVEKPLGITQAECQEMVAAVRASGVNAAVCHTQRYVPEIRALKRYCESSEGKGLGRLRHAQDYLNFGYFNERRPKWFFDPAQAGGGLLMTHGAHQVDRLHWLMGITRGQVLAARMEELKAYPGIDSGYQFLAEADGLSYAVSCSGYPSPHSSSVQLDFENGSLRAELFDNGLVKKGMYLGKENGYTRLMAWEEQEDPYQLQFEELLDALEGKTSDAPTLLHSAEVVRVLDAVAV